jgi:hypothetical protein
VAGALVLALAGACGSHSSLKGSATSVPTTAATGAAQIPPNPIAGHVASWPGPGQTILYDSQGHGNLAIDLSKLPRSARSVDLIWTCVGGTGVDLFSGSSDLGGSGCQSNSPGGDNLSVPIDSYPVRGWHLDACASTSWWLVVVADTQNAPALQTPTGVDRGC